MSQLFTYPPVNVTATNPSVGLDGDPAPAYATEIGGVDASGNLVPVSVDPDGTVNVSVVDTPLPPGAATAANQVIEIGHLSNIETSDANIDANTAAIFSDTTAIRADTGSISTSTGTTLSLLQDRLAGSLTNVAYDEVVLTYIPSGPGAGQLGTAVYKKNTVTVATLTLTYDGSDRLAGVVRT